jgi:hypothetical protein
VNINKLVIDYLLSHSGQLPKGETWYDVGIKCGVEAPDKKRAKKDRSYKKKSIGREAQRQWQRYLNQKNDLSLDKEIYENGELKWETFKKKPEDVQINHDDYDIEKITTNPYGGAWFKLKKKENFYVEEHLEKLTQILTENITPLNYELNVEHNEKGLFIFGADKHIGALTKENSVYTNKYDKQEIKRRLIQNTLQEIETWVSEFGAFNSLFIMDLGDALDGYNQKTTGGLRGTSSHTLPQQLNNREQHDFYVEVHKELFDILATKQYAKDIYFIATSNSNHGGDFEYGAIRHLETYLNIKYPNIRTYVSYKPLNHFFYGKHCIIFGHGKDDEDMKSGLPLTLNEKVKNYINDYITVNNLNEYTISFISADLHQSAETYGDNFRYKKVLSQYGSTKWMHTNFGSGSPGLSSEVFVKDKKKIYKTDEFFEIDNQSNTGIDF